MRLHLRVHSEASQKLKHLQLFKKFPAFYRSRSFVSVFTRPHTVRCSVMYSVCLSSFSCSAVLTVLTLMLTIVSHLQLKVRLTSCCLTIHTCLTLVFTTCLHHCVFTTVSSPLVFTTVVFTTHISILYYAGNAV
jgi:hypothetical protein